MRGRFRRPNPAQLSLFDPSVGPVRRPRPDREPWGNGELLCFDLETTGTDRFNDVPVSLALVRVLGGVTLERTIRIVDPGRTIPLEATAVHGISTERARREGMALSAAIELVVQALLDASRRGVPVVGVKLEYDLTIVDVLCRAADGNGLRARGWTGPVLDALVLDRHLDPYRTGRRTLSHLCETYGVRIDRAHSAECDAQAAAEVLLSMAARYGELARASLHDLHLGQVEYHRAWFSSFNEWRRSRGLGALDPTESSWPLAAMPTREAGAA